MKVFDEEYEVEEEATVETQETLPTIYDPGWHEYVMSELTDEEKDIIGETEYPKVSGLRRVVGKLIGDITESKTKLNVVPGFASAVCRIMVENFDGKYIIVEGAADASVDNTDFPYNKHLSAIAETRAEGRALRKLLNLRTQASEEVGAANELTSEDNTPKFVTDNQLSAMDVLAKRTDINLVAMLAQEGLNLNVKKIPYADAQEFFKKLSGYQNVDIPEELKGYNNDWRAK